MLDWRSDAHKLTAEVAAHDKDIKDCKANSKFTQESSHALNDNLDGIDAYYDSLLESGATNMQPASNSGQVPRCPNSSQSSGLTFQQKKLNDEQAAKLISCQAKICHIYKINGQEDLLPAGKCSVD